MVLLVGSPMAYICGGGLSYSLLSRIPQKSLTACTKSGTEMKEEKEREQAEEGGCASLYSKWKGSPSS